MIKFYAVTPGYDSEDARSLNANLPLIVRNSEQILADNRMYCCMVICLADSALFTGARCFSLGMALEMWGRGGTQGRCRHRPRPRCGGTVYIMSASGSPLSGRHSWPGLCGTCGLCQSGNEGRFGRLLGPVFRIVEANLGREGAAFGIGEVVAELKAEQD